MVNEDEEGTFDAYLTPAVKQYISDRMVLRLKEARLRKNRQLPLTLDVFETLMINAFDDAATEGLIPDHCRLGCGITLSQDEDFFNQVRAACS